MNSRSASNQPFPPEKGKPGECPPDNELAENSQENLDARLDHAVEEPSPRAIPCRSTSPQGRSLIALLRKFPPHRGMTSRITRSRTQLSTFWIR
jgi:hypothetical protein